MSTADFNAEQAQQELEQLAGQLYAEALAGESAADTSQVSQQATPLASQLQVNGEQADMPLAAHPEANVDQNAMQPGVHPEANMDQSAMPMGMNPEANPEQQAMSVATQPDASAEQIPGQTDLLNQANMAMGIDYAQEEAKIAELANQMHHSALHAEQAENESKVAQSSTQFVASDFSQESQQLEQIVSGLFDPHANTNAMDANQPQAAGAHPLNNFRQDFPILQKQIHGHPLVWFDNAATTQKPESVIDAESEFYREYNSNVHRGVHTLSQQATQLYEDARENVAHFIHARAPEEIVFLRGTTEAINLVAHGLSKSHLSEGDEILISQLEHHSNILPWQKAARESGATLRSIPIKENGDICQESYQYLLSDKTKVVALSHVSNALGTVVPIKMMIDMAHQYGAVVLIDGAQSIGHLPINVKALDCDFFAFSGHKMFAPTGIGGLYGKRELLENLPPYQEGGGMIKHVSLDSVEYAPLPFRHEAGTGNLAGAYGLSATIDYLNKIGMHTLETYEHELTEYAYHALKHLPFIRLIGEPENRVAVFSFLVKGADPEEVGKFLDERGIAVRTGHHCAQPTMQRYGLEETVRASLSFYNTKAEIDKFIMALKEFASTVS